MCPGIVDNALIASVGLMNLFKQSSLAIGLKTAYLYPALIRIVNKELFECRKTLRTVDPRLAHAKHI